jgi:signal transduction histidine kinase
MGIEVLLATAAAVVSLYAGLFHAWVFALHPRAREHLWVAVTAIGACTVSAGTALVYTAADATTALHAQQIQIIGAPVVTLGALRFTACRLRFDAPLFLASPIAFAIVLVGIGIFAPGLLLATDRAPRETVVFSTRFLQFDLARTGAVLLGVSVIYFVSPLVLSARAFRRHDPHATSLLVCFALWTAAGLSDSAVGLGAYDLPYLMPTGGYMVVAVTLSAILMRDLASAMDESERLGAQLQDLAETGADALRAIDLRLARGEQHAAIGMLAAGVAHEINNPLAYVSANLNQLRAMWDEEHDPDEVKEILAESREGLARVGTIVADLLRMASQGDGERESCDLGDVVRGVLPLVAREAGASIEVAIDVASPLPVWGSARLLGQVALNLALNAVQAVPDAPDRAPRVELCVCASRGGVELSVRDNGPGIPPDLIDQIFEPSFTTKPIGRGTGLGLALTRLVVARHHGSIDVKSGPEGTTVTVWLPAAGGRA